MSWRFFLLQSFLEFEEEKKWKVVRIYLCTYEPAMYMVNGTER